MFICDDQLLRKVSLHEHPPKRIISLVPSQTELLSDLGLNEEVIAITKFCVHPENWFKNKIKIGGTKNINIEKIKSLKPDLIIANKEENVKEQIEELEKTATVWISDINTLEDALNMIEAIGAITGKNLIAKKIIEQIIKSFSNLKALNRKIKTAYLIWREPYMATGGDTFISNMMEKCGLENIFKNQKRYPQIALETIAELDCELILLSSEPYPFKQKHVKEIELQMPKSKVILVDGEIFSWYGSRLLYATDYFYKLIEEVKSSFIL